MLDSVVFSMLPNTYLEQEGVGGISRGGEGVERECGVRKDFKEGFGKGE